MVRTPTPTIEALLLTPAWAGGQSSSPRGPHTQYGGWGSLVVTGSPLGLSGQSPAGMDTCPPHQVRGLTAGCWQRLPSTGVGGVHRGALGLKGARVQGEIIWTWLLGRGWLGLSPFTQRLYGPRLGPAPRPVPEFVCLSITFEKQGEIPESQMVDGTMQGYRLEPVGMDPEGPGTSLAGHGVQAVVQPQCSLCEGVPSSLNLSPTATF